MTARRTLPLFDAPSATMEAAAAWLARRDRGFTSEEAAQFAAWVQADASREAAVRQLHQAMTAFDQIGETVPPLAGEPDPDYFAKAPSRRRWGWAAAVPLGLAAALAIVVWSSSTPARPTTTLITATHGYERATLEDGSTVDLNSNTSIEIEFNSTQRQVRLMRGEAHFRVVKDQARPFVVKADAVAVRALGTAFTVRLEKAAVEVMVTAGQVLVDPQSSSLQSQGSGSTGSAQASVLGVRQKTIVALNSPPSVSTVTTLTEEEVQAALFWQSRVVEFAKTSLVDIVAHFNRQNRLQLHIADPELRSLRLGGNFRMDQPEAFARLLETSFGVEVEWSANRIVFRKAR